MVCMCVGARGVRTKTRAQVVRESIVEHQEESVAHNHEPRRSGRIHARGDIAHPSIVLAKWLLSEFMVVKPSEACIVSMLKRACKASGGPCHGESAGWWHDDMVCKHAPKADFHPNPQIPHSHVGKR